jgi:hypothetical protein
MDLLPSTSTQSRIVSSRRSNSMDHNQVRKFCDVVAQLVGPLATYAGTVDDRSPADDALVRQLRVAGGAINEALSQVARLTPPTPPPMPRPAPASESATAT